MYRIKLIDVYSVNICNNIQIYFENHHFNNLSICVINFYSFSAQKQIMQNAFKKIFFRQNYVICFMHCKRSHLTLNNYLIK